MAKPDNDNFLGKPATFNKVGGRAVEQGEVEAATPPPAAKVSATKIAVVIGLIVLVAFLIYVGENGLGGVTHRHGRGGHGVDAQDVDKARDQGSNF